MRIFFRCVVFHPLANVRSDIVLHKYSAQFPSLKVFFHHLMIRLFSIYSLLLPPGMPMPSYDFIPKQLLDFLKQVLLRLDSICNDLSTKHAKHSAHKNSHVRQQHEVDVKQQ